MPLLDNESTDPSIIETRYRSGRVQADLNIELALTTAESFSSTSPGSATGGGGGMVGGLGEVNNMTGGTAPPRGRFDDVELPE